MESVPLLWRRLAASCGPSIARVYEAKPQYGHLLELPAESAPKATVQASGNEADARSVVAGRLRQFFHTVQMSHHIAPQRVALSCAMWRLDCADSPSSSDLIGNATRAGSADLAVDGEFSLTAYSVNDVKTLQVFSRGSTERSAHAAACAAMARVAKRANHHFAHVTTEAPQSPKFNAHVAVPMTHAAPRLIATGSRPKDVEARLQASLRELLN
jgi:hypothetical protein